MPSRRPRVALAIATLSVLAMVATAAISVPAMAAPPPDKGTPTPSATATESPTPAVPEPDPNPNSPRSPNPKPLSPPSPDPVRASPPRPSLHRRLNAPGRALLLPDPETEPIQRPRQLRRRRERVSPHQPRHRRHQPRPRPPPPTPGYPDVMAAAGDSITLAYNSTGYGSLPQYSWSTGTASTLNSLLQRLQTASASTIKAVNVAQVGAKSDALATQVDSAIAAQADYLTVEIGANDACTPTVGEMTAFRLYQARIKAALTKFHEAKPDNRIFVASIPSLYKCGRSRRTSSARGWSGHLPGSASRCCSTRGARTKSTKIAGSKCRRVSRPTTTR